MNHFLVLSVQMAVVLREIGGGFHASSLTAHHTHAHTQTCTHTTHTERHVYTYGHTCTDTLTHTYICFQFAVNVNKRVLLRDSSRSNQDCESAGFLWNEAEIIVEK